MAANIKYLDPKADLTFKKIFGNHPDLLISLQREFMQQVLHDHLNVRKLFIGYDHRFGHNREETFEDYVRYGKEMGIEVIRNEAFQIDGINISSSVIRSFLKEGEVEMAARCLGFPYTLIGKVHIKVINMFHHLKEAIKDWGNVTEQIGRAHV